MKLFAVLPIALGGASALSAVASRQNDVDNTPTFSYKELWDLQDGFWQKFMWPNNLKEAQSINSTVFSEDVLGRVAETRNFEGRELNTEYIFGLFTPSTSVGVVGRPMAYQVTQFAANQNIASATTRIDFAFPSFQNMTLPVIIDTWITWNSAKQITQYDATFRWFAYFLETLVGSIDPTDPVKAQKTAVNLIAKSICGTHQTYCNGTNTQYESADACYKFLTEDIRVGQAFELGMNTLMCRSVHEIMIKYRPNVHCPHIGPSGGGMCVDDMSYQFKVDEDYFKISPFIPSIGSLEGS